jgi:hypothetical protein
MRAPDAAAGKKVKCPKCRSAIPVPAAQPAGDFEFLNDAPARSGSRSASRPAVVKPKVKTDVEVDEDEDDQPRKRTRAADDDEDDRPRRKKKKKKRVRSSMTREIVGAVVLLILLGVAGFVFYDKFKKREIVESGPSVVIVDDPPPPALGPRGPKQPSSPVTATLPYTAIRPVVLSLEGRRLAVNGLVAAGDDNPPASSIRVWDAAGHGPAGAREFRSPKQGPNSRLALSPDGRTLAAVSADGAKACAVTFWNAATGAVVGEGTGPADATAPGQPAFTPDGTAVVFASDAGLVTAVAATGEVSVRRTQDQPSGRAVYVPGLNRVAVVRTTADRGGAELALWDPTADGPPTVVRLDGVKTGPAGFAVSPDGKVVVVGSDVRDPAGTDQGSLTVHDVPTGKKLAQGANDEDKKCRRYPVLTLSADGKFFAAVGGGVGAPFNAVSVFRTADAKRLSLFAGPATQKGYDFATEPQLSPDGKTLFYVQRGSRIARIDLESGIDTNR